MLESSDIASLKLWFGVTRFSCELNPKEGRFMDRSCLHVSRVPSDKRIDRSLSRVVCALSLSVLAGCALVSVNLKGPKGICGVGTTQNGSGVKAGQREVAYCDSPGDAIKYAAGWRQVFLNAAGQHSAARNSTALVGIPAASVAGFYGSTGHGSTDRISRLSFGAAGVYGSSAFLAPKGKQQAYLEGALALSCLMDRAVPYHVGADRVSNLKRRILEAQAGLSALDMLISSAELPSTSRVMTRANVVRSNAQNMLVTARAVRDAHEKSGMRIAIAVDRIVAQTAQLASSQESNLDSLLVMAGGIRGSAGQFGLSILPPEEKSGKPPKSPAEQRVAKQGYQVEQALTVLREKLEELHTAILDLEPPKETPEFAAICSPDTAAVGFSVIPAESSQTVKVGDTLEFKVTNSKSDSFATYTLTGNGADFVKPSGPEVKNGKLTISVTGEKATGTTPVVLLIDDPTGTIRKRYEIHVISAN